MARTHYMKHFHMLPDDTEEDVELEYTATPYIPAVLYGDNSSPAEGGEIELLKVTNEAGEITWSDKEEQVWLDYIAEHHRDEEPDYD